MLRSPPTGVSHGIRSSAQKECVLNLRKIPNVAPDQISQVDTYNCDPSANIIQHCREVQMYTSIKQSHGPQTNLESCQRRAHIFRIVS